jgi:hha toxicity modulator TomB
MDEYSPKRHDIAQLKFLCENLHDEGMNALGDSHHGWVNDPTASVNLQLNDLIEHIASFAMSFRIKYSDESGLSELIEEYLNDTYMLFTSYSINESDLRRWQKTKVRISRMFLGESLCTTMKT